MRIPLRVQFERPVTNIGSNDFGEEIYRVGVEAEVPLLAGWSTERETPCATATASRAGHRSPFGALRQALRLIAARSFLGNKPPLKSS